MSWLRKLKKKIKNRKVTGTIEREAIVAMLADYFGEKW